MRKSTGLRDRCGVEILDGDTVRRIIVSPQYLPKRFRKPSLWTNKIFWDNQRGKWETELKGKKTFVGIGFIFNDFPDEDNPGKTYNMRYLEVVKPDTNDLSS